MSLPSSIAPSCPRSDFRRRALGGTHEAVRAALSDLRGGDLLDAPAGEGALARDLFDAGFTPTCLDVRLAPNRWTGARWIAHDLDEELPFDDGAFDAATCVEGIEHIENPWRLAREFHRVLRPGGRLVVTTPNILSIRSRFRFFTAGYHRGFKYFDPGGGHITVLELPQLLRILARAGFSIRGVTANRRRGKYRPLRWLLNLFVRAKNPYAREILSPDVTDGDILVVSAER